MKDGWSGGGGGGGGMTGIRSWDVLACSCG